MTQKAYKNDFNLDTSYVFFRKINYTGKVEALGMGYNFCILFLLWKYLKKKILRFANTELQGPPPSSPTGNGWLRGLVLGHRIFHLSVTRF